MKDAGIMPSLTPNSRATQLARFRADQAERWRRGDRVRVEQYLADHPELAADAEAVRDLILAEADLRLERGEQPIWQEYLERFPAHAADLQHSWPTQPRPAPSENGAPDSTVPQTSATPSLPRSPDAAPSLPGFEIHEKLGEGGMGVVYRARDVRLDRPRAIKVIRPGTFVDNDALERFNREAKAVARLDHPGVVRIYALGEHEGTHYICMEYLAGGSLRGRLLGGPLDVRAAAELVQQLAVAVQHAHDNSVLHRDLKPANVLLTADGVPRVSDFGLAKLLDADDELTQSGAVMGTPSYMAPEQAEGRLDDVGVRTDVWALGAILYECLVGRPPFKEESPSATRKAVRTQDPVPPHRLRAEVPPELEAVCLKCLEKRPGLRYASAAALAADLGNWLESKPTRARPARGLRRVLHGLRRRPLLTLLLSVLLLCGLTAAGLAYFSHPDRLLWQEQAQLDRGESVELIGHTGTPRWFRWAHREKDTSLGLDAEGATLVQGWGLTLVELLPDTRGRQRYRIHASIRHQEAGKEGYVGLYFARTNYRTGKLPAISFLYVPFSDLRKDGDALLQLRAKLAKLPNRDLLLAAPVPTRNSVTLASEFVAEQKNDPPWKFTSTVSAAETFVPAGNSDKRGEWRSLTIEVTPERIRYFWNDQLVREVKPSDVAELDRQHLRDYCKKNSNNLAAASIEPRLDLGGGLGLFLSAGSASFRDVRVVPFEETP